MKGLTKQEVRKKIADGEVNTKIKKNYKSYREIIQSNILTYFNAINLVLFLLVISAGSYRNALFFLVVISNSAVGIFQEVRAKRMLDRLEIMVENKVMVIRDNNEETISIYDLVRHDLYLCKSGMQVPADSVVISGEIETDESLLTGEMKPQRKVQENMIYGGSFVVSGEAFCQIEHVGDENKSQQILSIAKGVKRQEIVLKKALNKMIKIIGVFLMPIGLLLFYNQRIVLQLGYTSSIVQTTSAIIGMIPSGLIFLTSVSLAIGVFRLGKRQILVQELHAVETLARTTTVCLDKTGTLTHGKHHIQAVESNEDRLDEIMGNYCAVFPYGNATSQALVEHFGIQVTYQIKEKLAFSSSRKYSAISFDNEGTYYLGAKQVLFPSDRTLDNNGGLRTLVLAKSMDTQINEELPQDLELVATFFIRDQIRNEAPEIISYFKKQHVRCFVFSGDDPQTVSQIAKEVGIDKADQWIDATKVSMTELKSALLTHAVFGRLVPEQKMELIQTLQSSGEVVTMVGDGVNDIPALKAADLSVALGNGSDATKNMSNLVLLNSDFSNFPKIVDEGRRVMNNLGTASSMFLIKSLFSMILAVLVLLFDASYPFLPIQLTVIGIFSVGIPTFLLQFEPSEKPIHEKFFEQSIIKALPSAILIALGALSIFLIGQHVEYSQKLIFTMVSIFSASVYTLSLYVIYTPLTKIRLAVIVAMQLSLGLVFSIFSPFLEFVAVPLVPSFVLAGLVLGGFVTLFILHKFYNDKTRS
ncbi:MAG: HAD-IC family P-type ATPase [Anaerorhabdus sp.]